MLEQTHWVFDLDGTLTIGAHDFAGIRRSLGLPEGRGILESIAELEPERAAVAMRWLDDHEYELACDARAADGADALLAALVRRGVRRGIVTRNSLRNLEATLAAAGLSRYFERSGFVTRELTAPKPRPDGILHLLGLWQAPPAAAVMVGNHAMDLLAGRAAGTTTVHVDPSGTFPWSEHADVQVTSLNELVELLAD
jgi:HAD superfamily hydrolase (TIGR01509 family)